MDGHKEYVQIDQNDLFPFLLVNVGSGVSIIKVTLRLALYFILLVSATGSFLTVLFQRLMGMGSFSE
jgi:pantothenate kinase